MAITVNLQETSVSVTVAASGGDVSVTTATINPVDVSIGSSVEWSAATVSQAEAEAGTATTRRAWTAQRVRQAIVAAGVSLPSGTEGQVLTYVGGSWVAAAPSGAVLSVAGKTGTVTLTTSDITGLDTALSGKAPLASPAFTGTVSGITKSMVGLGNVDNTSDAAKPVSTATQTALDGKQATLPNGNYLDLLSFNGSSWTNVAAADYATATGLVRTSDARLSDARTPLSHTHAAADVIFAATDRLIGRSSSGAGAGEEIVCTAAGRALLDDADAAAQRTTLGLGTAATSSTGDFAAASHNHAASAINTGTLGVQRLPARVRASTSLYLWSVYR